MKKNWSTEFLSSQSRHGCGTRSCRCTIPSTALRKDPSFSPCHSPTNGLKSPKSFYSKETPALTSLRDSLYCSFPAFLQALPFHTAISPLPIPAPFSSTHICLPTACLSEPSAAMLLSWYFIHSSAPEHLLGYLLHLRKPPVVQLLLHGMHLSWNHSIG